MPAVSKAQLRWVNSPAGHRALGEAGVQEWDAASKGLHLPERKKKGIRCIQTLPDPFFVLTAIVSSVQSLSHEHII